MTLSSPTTYAEWYWKHSVDATSKFDEDMESALSPFIRGMFADMPDLTELPEGIRSFIAALSEPPSAGFGTLISLTGAEFGAEILKEGLKPAMMMMQRANMRRTTPTFLTSDQANILFRRGKIDADYWALITESEGYDPVIGRGLYDSQIPYPAIADLMLWGRYHGDPDNTRDAVWAKFDVPVDDYELYEWLTLQRLTTEQLQSLFKRGLVSEGEFFTELARVGWNETDRIRQADLMYLIPNAMLLVQGNLQQGIGEADILADISRADIHPDYAVKYLDAILTKPASADLINYTMRQDPELSGIERGLRKLGIHPDYFDVYKTLAYPIPPIADIITMAVREAFTPAIAERFGQYEDFPPEFEYWAKRKGLTEDWAKRYWAAHWALPSATQGFSMLHRGIINSDELGMLLRAQDVMPFWRTKLIQVAYRPLTRVDVRRMYKEGVLDEQGVYRAYLDHGYSEDNAEAMTKFTISYVLGQLTKFTSRDVISAYTKRMITRSAAGGMMRDLGIRSEDVSYILSTADYKRDWALTDAKVSGIRNLYKRKVLDENQTRGELLKLDLPTEQVDVLMEQWYYEIKDEVPRTWTTSQTLGFIKSNLITPDRGRRELELIGYDSEHINIYMESLA